MKKEKLKLFLVLHHHRFGMDYAFVRAKKMPSDELACKAAKLHFEPEREEYLDIMEVHPEDAPEI